jgi:hypothetical protein
MISGRISKLNTPIKTPAVKAIIRWSFSRNLIENIPPKRVEKNVPMENNQNAKSCMLAAGNDHQTIQ